MAPSHHLKQCGLIIKLINNIPWHWSQWIIIKDLKIPISEMRLKLVCWDNFTQALKSFIYSAVIIVLVMLRWWADIHCDPPSCSSGWMRKHAFMSIFVIWAPENNSNRGLAYSAIGIGIELQFQFRNWIDPNPASIIRCIEDMTVNLKLHSVKQNTHSIHILQTILSITANFWAA